MGNIHTSGPNEALIISGGCCGGENKKRTVVGGWGWAWWCVSGKLDLMLSTWKNFIRIIAVLIIGKISD